MTRRQVEKFMQNSCLGVCKFQGLFSMSVCGRGRESKRPLASVMLAIFCHFVSFCHFWSLAARPHYRLRIAWKQTQHIWYITQWLQKLVLFSTGAPTACWKLTNYGQFVNFVNHKSCHIVVECLNARSWTQCGGAPHMLSALRCLLSFLIPCCLPTVHEDRLSSIRV